MGVGCRIGGLASAAPDSRDRGEEDERVKRPLLAFVREHLVQVHRPGDLGVQNGFEAGGVQIGQRMRRGLSGRVQHCPYRCAGGPEAVRQFGECGAVGDVTRCDGDSRSERDEFIPQLCRTRGVHAPSAGEHQPLGAVAGGPAGHVSPQDSRTTGDQYRPAR